LVRHFPQHNFAVCESYNHSSAKVAFRSGYPSPHVPGWAHVTDDLYPGFLHLFEFLVNAFIGALESLSRRAFSEKKGEVGPFFVGFNQEA
jgi:hypothetical protein